jgi:uncharacterized RDD family membrane protein YckC
MKTRKRDHSLGEGVYYAADDYIGIGRRIVLICVDLTVIILGGVVLAWTLATVDAEGSERSMMRAALYSWLLYVALVAAYMTVIKASKIRTIGYRVAGTKIVDLRGRRPSIFRMLFRLSLWVLGPFSFVFDLIWAGIDEDRQTLRDRFAGTCVIRNCAESVGRGEIHMAYFTGGGFALVYPHVTHREAHEGTADE